MSLASSRYLTTGQIATELGCASRTVAKWIDEGSLPGIRLPTRSISEKAGQHRRVLKSDLDNFIRLNKFPRMTTARLVLAVGCEVEEPGDLEVISAGSAFEVGLVICDRMPQYIVVDWALGRLVAGEIARGCAALGGYSPILVARSLSSSVPDEEFGCVGYPYVMRCVTGPALFALAGFRRA